MPSYFYKAKKDAAHTITGQISAQNEEEAVELIHQLGLVPVSVEEKTSQGTLVKDIQTVKVKNKEVYLFSRQLSSLIKSGVPLLRALEVLSGEVKTAYFARVLSDITIGVKSGRPFSNCLADYPGIFSPLYVAMIRAGEEMGHLREMLSNIADFLKKQEDFSSKVRAALVYPAIMLSVGIGTVFFILTFVMPKMAVIFADSGQKLPMPTIIVMTISRFLKQFWMPIAIGVLTAVLSFVSWRRTPHGTSTIGRFCVAIPWIRQFVVKADLARFARTLHLLINSGLPLVRAMETAIPTVHNPQLRTELFTCVEGLTSGDSLAESLRTSSLLPSMAVQMIAVGEESGSLNDSLLDIAEAYERDIDESAKLITTLLEPLMILGIGLVIGFIVFAMLMPIFSMDLLAR